MEQKKITFNAIAAILQVVIIGVIYLVLYRYILVEIGIKLLGVWSLIIASTSLMTLANFGISSSVVKFVAYYFAKNRLDLIAKLLFTSTIFVLGTYTIFSLILYLVANQFLYLLIEEGYMDAAMSILPFSLLSLIFNTVGGVYLSSIDGVQKNFIKSFILIVSALILLILSILLTPVYGLLGLVYAQIAQSIINLLISLFFVFRIFNLNLKPKWHWDTTIFKEVLSYGIKIQASSLLQMTFDPITKFLLSKFGGLTVVGLYEMAFRLVMQLRGIIVNANQVMVPVIAEKQVKDLKNIVVIYKKSFSLILFLNILLLTAIIVLIPYIAILWIGYYEKIFVIMVIPIAISMFFNISSNPAYFSYLGEGNLNWIVISNVFNFLIILLMGFVTGYYFGPYAVAISNSFAAVLSSFIIMRSYHLSKKINYLELLKKEDFQLVLSSILLMSFSNLLFNFFDKPNLWLLLSTATFISLCCFLFFVFQHTNYHNLKKMMKSIL